MPNSRRGFLASLLALFSFSFTRDAGAGGGGGGGGGNAAPKFQDYKYPNAKIRFYNNTMTTASMRLSFNVGGGGGGFFNTTSVSPGGYLFLQGKTSQFADLTVRDPNSFFNTISLTNVALPANGSFLNYEVNYDAATMTTTIDYVSTTTT